MTGTPLKTKNSSWIDFKLVDHGDRGLLQIAEGERNIPFPIRRTMVTSGMKKGEVRGEHAHKLFDQVIVPLRGSFTLHLDDGATTEDIVLDNPARGIRMGPKLWHKMSDFSDDAVILVFCDQYHDEADYLRDYDEFIDFIKNN